MMQFFSRFLAIFAVAARRLMAQQGLAISTAIGLIASVAIVMSIPLYSDAIYYQVLQNELSKPSSEGELQRPPFGFMFRYVGSLYGLLEWGDIEQVDSYLWERGPELIGLPNELKVRYFRTDNFRLFPASDAAYADVRDPLAWINFSTATDFGDKITLLEGAMPAVADSDPASPMEILVNVAMADKYGIQVGESFITFRRSEKEGSQRVTQVPVVVSGIWQAADPNDPYWFYRQSVFEGQFFIPEESFQLRLVPLLDDEIAQALWYFVDDGSSVSSDDVGWLLNNISFVQQQVASILPNTRLEVSPFDALVKYRRSSGVLNVLLYAFSIPIIGLMLAFIGLVVGLAVSRQRNEIAVLRSRGATIVQVLGIAALEAMLLGLVALTAGIPVSEQIAKTIGATRSFLNFTILDTGLRVDMTMTTLRFGLIAVVITMVAQVFPSLGASRHTIITYKREQGRTVRAPWWQRAWLDVLLLIPAGYGTYLLQQQGSVVMPGAADGSPFGNPLLFLIPALGALALTLFVLRLLPYMMAGIAWLAAKTSSVGFLLATRYLARDPAFYTAPLVLLILTLSLSTFTASLAQTLDAHLYDQTYYKIGADALLVELGQTAAPATDSSSTQTAATADSAATPASGAATGTTTGGGQSTITEERWVFVPVSEHLNVPEIKAAARVGDFNASIQAQGNWTDARFIGIDRLDYPKVAYWRHDFATASLGALMNSLAIAPDGILLYRDFMVANSIKVGDPIQIRVTSYGQRAEMTMTVVGDFEYFPTWYANDEDHLPLMVGNLDHYFEMAGGEVPYNVLIKTDPAANMNEVVRDLRKFDITALDVRNTRQTIADEQRKPERQGLFGVLSVGFLAAALLTVLGFFLYALFSFRRRFIELGTLRAIGLSPGQMTAFLAWELAFVVLLGLGAGTVLGALVSNLYIPYLQVGNTPQALTPPFLVDIAWPAIFRIYILFGALFIVALSVLAALLLRMKIFQAIKLGETV
jgi:putative ABC transport system permease protein